MSSSTIPRTRMSMQQIMTALDAPSEPTDTIVLRYTLPRTRAVGNEFVQEVPSSSAFEQDNTFEEDSHHRQPFQQQFVGVGEEESIATDNVFRMAANKLMGKGANNGKELSARGDNQFLKSQGPPPLRVRPTGNSGGSNSSTKMQPLKPRANMQQQQNGSGLVTPALPHQPQQTSADGNKQRPSNRGGLRPPGPMGGNNETARVRSPSAGGQQQARPRRNMANLEGMQSNGAGGLISFSKMSFAAGQSDAAPPSNAEPSKRYVGGGSRMMTQRDAHSDQGVMPKRSQMRYTDPELPMPERKGQDHRLDRNHEGGAISTDAPHGPPRKIMRDSPAPIPHGDRPRKDLPPRPAWAKPYLAGCPSRIDQRERDYMPTTGPTEASGLPGMQQAAIREEMFPGHADGSLQEAQRNYAMSGQYNAHANPGGARKVSKEAGYDPWRNDAESRAPAGQQGGAFMGENHKVPDFVMMQEPQGRQAAPVAQGNAQPVQDVWSHRKELEADGKLEDFRKNAPRLAASQHPGQIPKDERQIGTNYGDHAVEAPDAVQGGPTNAMVDREHPSNVQNRGGRPDERRTQAYGNVAPGNPFAPMQHKMDNYDDGHANAEQSAPVGVHGPVRGGVARDHGPALDNPAQPDATQEAPRRMEGGRHIQPGVNYMHGDRDDINGQIAAPVGSNGPVAQTGAGPNDRPQLQYGDNVDSAQEAARAQRNHGLQHDRPQVGQLDENRAIVDHRAAGNVQGARYQDRPEVSGVAEPDDVARNPNPRAGHVEHHSEPIKEMRHVGNHESHSRLANQQGAVGSQYMQQDPAADRVVYQDQYQNRAAKRSEGLSDVALPPLSDRHQQIMLMQGKSTQQSARDTASNGDNLNLKSMPDANQPQQASDASSAGAGGIDPNSGQKSSVGKQFADLMASIGNSAKPKASFAQQMAKAEKQAPMVTSY